MNANRSTITIAAGLFVISMACLAMAGKYFHIPAFAQYLPGVVSMKFNSAVLFLLCGVSLLLLSRSFTPVASTIIAAIVVAGSALTLSEYIFHTDFGIDTLFFRQTAAKLPDPFPSRPSSTASFNFLLIGISLLLIRVRKAHMLIWILLQLVFLISVLAFIGYAFSIDTPNSFASFTMLFLHTAVIFMVLCAAVFYSSPLEHLNISFQRKLIAGFVLILLILSIVFLIYKANSDIYRKNANWVANANDIVQEADEGLSAVVSAESAVNSYIIQGDKHYIVNYAVAKTQAIQSLGRLKRIVTDSLILQTLSQLSQAVQERFALSDTLLHIRQNRIYSAVTASSLFSRSNAAMATVRALYKKVTAGEKKLLADRSQANKTTTDNAQRIFYFFGFIMPVILIVLGFIIFRNFNAKKKAEARAVDLAATLEKRVVERTDELLRSEHRFQQTLDNMMEGAQLIDFDWKYVYVNNALVEQSGRTREQLIGHTMMENYPGIEQSEMFNVYNQCLQDRVAVHMENQFTFPDGSIGWFELKFQPVPDGMFILSTDISERKRSEAAVRSLNADIAVREKKFRALIESSNDIISLSDKEFVPFYRSPSAAKLTGWLESDRLAAGSVIDRTHPDDLAQFKEDIRQSFAQPGVPIPVSIRSRTKQGHYIWLEGSITNMLHDEALGAIVTNLQDVSLRKESEDKLRKSELIYRTIASGIPRSVICLFDKEERYILVEGDMLEKFGYSKEALTGQKMSDVLPPERYAAIHPDVLRVLDGETFSTESTREGYDTLSRFVPLKDEHDQVYAAMIVIFEVSELKNAQRAITALNESLEQKVLDKTAELQESIRELQSTQQQLVQQAKLASLGELTAGIAHEIQNPLNFVNNFSDLNIELVAEIKEALQEADPVVQELIADLSENSQKILFHGKRADNIVKSMLQHSRRNPGNKEPTDIALLADEYLRLSYHGLRAKDKSFNAKFELTSDPSLGKVNVVPQDMGRVLLNLINNAFHAVGEKKKSAGEEYDPTVSVAIRRISNDRIEISVRDNGTGMSESTREKILQPFFTTKPTGQGTGLGLSISNDIITQLHKGELKILTKEGEGTEFIISLPV